MKAATSLHTTNAVKRAGTAEPPFSSHGIPKASAMARYAAASRVVEAARASEYLCRAVQFGILEQPSIPFSSGEVMNPISQTPEDLAFGREDLRAGCQKGIYEEVATGEAERIRSTGAMISSIFVVWQDGPEGRKGRFVVNLSKQSKHWPKGSVRMETLPEYALELEHGEKMVSFDIQAGYRHFFRLAPQMRDWFLFRYDGRLYRCIALPFGWGRSPM
jgi:hypothetical protein